MSQSAANELWQKLSGVRRKVVDESRLSRGKINLLFHDRSRLETRKLINIEMRDYTFRNLCNAKFTNCKILRFVVRSKLSESRKISHSP